MAVASKSNVHCPLKKSTMNTGLIHLGLPVHEGYVQLS